MTTCAAEARAEWQLDAIARGLARADPDLDWPDGPWPAPAVGGVLGGSPTALAAGAVALALPRSA